MARKIRILSVGRQHEQAVAYMIEDYQNRLARAWQLEWQFLPPKTAASHESSIIDAESKSIMATLKNAEYVLLLDERGELMDSITFSARIATALERYKNVTCVIGGAYGVNAEVRNRADTVISLGKMTYPHQLVRVMLSEQLYRAHTIAAGLPYHHGHTAA